MVEAGLLVWRWSEFCVVAVVIQSRGGCGGLRIVIERVTVGKNGGLVRDGEWGDPVARFLVKRGQ